MLRYNLTFDVKGEYYHTDVNSVCRTNAVAKSVEALYQAFSVVVEPSQLIDINCNPIQ